MGEGGLTKVGFLQPYESPFLGNHQLLLRFKRMAAGHRTAGGSVLMFRRTDFTDLREVIAGVLVNLDEDLFGRTPVFGRPVHTVAHGAAHFCFHGFSPFLCELPLIFLIP
jgi:hypothetical protein